MLGEFHETLPSNVRNTPRIRFFTIEITKLQTLAKHHNLIIEDVRIEKHWMILSRGHFYVTLSTGQIG